jgi:hypothetical protein
MFNRFTQRALRVLFCARSEVSQLGSSAVEPEHILIGLLVGAQFAVDSTVMRALPRPASSTELTLEVTFG